MHRGDALELIAKGSYSWAIVGVNLCRLVFTEFIGIPVGSLLTLGFAEVKQVRELLSSSRKSDTFWTILQCKSGFYEVSGNGAHGAMTETLISSFFCFLGRDIIAFLTTMKLFCSVFRIFDATFAELGANEMMFSSVLDKVHEKLQLIIRNGKNSPQLRHVATASNSRAALDWIL